MTTLAVITPSYAPDFEACADLHRSVLAFAPPEVVHHLIVPRADLALFSQLAGPRTQLHDEATFLPRSFVRLPRVNFTVNLRRPAPPVRGWILQQVIKLAAAARLDADVVVMVDSDIQFIRPFGVDTFVRDGIVRLVRVPDAVDSGLPRHVIWHDTARDLLGLPRATPPLPDYVSSLLAWDTGLVRQLLARVEEVTGRRWTDAVASRLHFSEWTLYGVYLDDIVGAPANSYWSADSLCRAYWEPTPLDGPALATFLDGIAPTDIAVMISAKSHTPLEVRRAGLAALSTN